MTSRTSSIVGLSLLWISACADHNGPGTEGPSAASTEVHGSAGTDGLEQGTRGAAVEQLQAALRHLGYLPNPELAVEYPGFKPAVEYEPVAGEYDATTRDAVSAFQRARGLPITGGADAETLQLVHGPHCGVPDHFGDSDSHDKFAFLSSSIGVYRGPFSLSSISWSVVGVPIRGPSGDVAITLTQAKAALRWIFGMYGGLIDKTFVEQTSGSPDILIDIKEYVNGIDGVPSKIAATAHATVKNGQRKIKVNALVPFSTATPTPNDSYDFHMALAHEVGHALGLEHSSIRARSPTSNGGVWVQNIMFPAFAAGPVSRSAQPDDRAGLSVLYNSFEQVPGLARDIGAGPHGDVWKISEIATGGGYRIFKRRKNDWVEASGDGGAVRLAVGPGGVVWAVNDGGFIYYHLGDPFDASGWFHVAGACARDIAVAANGGPWIAACDQSVKQYTFNQGWLTDPDERANFISVDAFGRPWIVGLNQMVKMRRWAIMAERGWDLKNITAFDVAVSPYTVPFTQTHIPWVIATDPASGGGNVFVRSEQALPPGVDAGVPVVNTWYKASSSGGANITATRDTVWFTDKNLRTFKQRDRQRLHFSYDGPIPGMVCDNVNEGADPEGTWSDNFLCAERDVQIEWSMAGQLPGRRCTAIFDPGEPSSTTWGDNFLCVPESSGLALLWSTSGPIEGLACEKWVEPAELHGWTNNYLCWI